MLLEGFQLLLKNTAILRNVVGKKTQKTAQANPERYFG